MKKKIYSFTLVLTGVNENTEGLEDALFESGCDDALINFKNGIVYLDFDRESHNLKNAIMSAIRDIERAKIGAKAHHLEGAYVTLSEIAKRTNFTKQAISLFIQGKRGAGNFPTPFSGVTSASPIWRWKDVVHWLSENEKLNDSLVVREADIVDEINEGLVHAK